MAIPNHQLGAIIGAGGMANVYRAEHVLLKQERAIKILSPELSRTPGFQESFLHEGRIVATLRHPHIISIHDIGCSEQGYFMAMEYLKGGSLKDRLARGPLALPEAVAILRQIGEALHHAHERGLIHRDIKPANILFRDDDDAVLTDFGISKLQSTDSDLTRHGYTMIGTPRYMSPEQTASQPLDRRSDIYSLALLFYEMLAGKAAIEGDNTLMVIREHALAPPPQLPSRYARLQPVLNKALAKQPGDRFATTLDFVRAVERNLDQREKTRVVRGGRGAGTSPARTWRRHAYYLVPLLLVSATALWKWSGTGHEATDDVDPKPSEEPTDNQGQKTLPQEDVVSAEKNDTPRVPPIIGQVSEPAAEPPPAVEPMPQPEDRPQSPPVIEPAQTPLGGPPSPDGPQATQEITVASQPPATRMRVRVNPYAIVYRQPGGDERLGRVYKDADVQVYGTVTTPDGREWKKVFMDGAAGFLKAGQLTADGVD